jgi:RNA polymerase sigma factor (sigma-70 family)
MDDEDALRLAQARLLAGDPLEPELQARVDAFMARVRSQVVRLGRGWTGDSQKAEDLAQEAITEAWNKLPAFRFGQNAFAPFVIGIGRNKLRNARRRISEQLTEDGVLDAASDVVGALERLRDEEQEEVLLASLGGLPPLEQDALYLRYVEGMQVEEITAHQRLDNASGARGVLQSARRHLEQDLRRALADMGHGSSFFRNSET